jgi:YbbR domain-containing protein
MTRPTSRLRGFFNNLGNLFVSIVLAMLVWIVAVQEANPSITRLYTTPIAIVPQNQPAGMITYGESARQVRVTLSGPQSAWDVLTPDRIAAAIDLSQQTTNTLDLPVQVTVADRLMRVVKVEPAVVSLKMEPVAEVTIPIMVNVVGEASPTYAVEPVETNPVNAVVRGPASLVKQVATAIGQLSIQDARATVSQTVQLAPRTSEGQSVLNVTLTPSTTLAVVRVQQLGGFRDLAVKIDLVGNVASGYAIANVSVNPQIVTIFGSPTTLDALPGFIATEPISVTDATSDREERVRLSLPSGVSILGDPFVQVRVRVRAIESSIKVQRAPVTQGLSPDLMAGLSPDVVDVIISGPVPILDALRADDVVVVLNLLNLEIGTHQVEPEVSVPNGLTVVSVNPATVQVIVSELITPTATITGTNTITSGLFITVTSPLPSPTPQR